LWATFSLGTKCSNLTNRGIVSTGAYGIVRHPAYISKNLSWFLMAIPIIGLSITTWSINWIALISIIGWMIIYFLRAITEERHLMQDSDYREYCKKVKYRFIPGLL
jgi:protein-S-isoprenylcysteine O-methyltransferase Ste14